MEARRSALGQECGFRGEINISPLGFRCPFREVRHEGKLANLVGIERCGKYSYGLPTHPRRKNPPQRTPRVGHPKLPNHAVTVLLRLYGAEGEGGGGVARNTGAQHRAGKVGLVRRIGEMLGLEAEPGALLRSAER